MSSKNEKLEFISLGKIPSGKEFVSCWTDGVCITSDGFPYCAFKIEEGKKYKVTIEECSFQEDIGGLRDE